MMEGCLISLKLVDSQLPWLDKCKKWVTADCLVTGSQGCLGGSKETHCRGAVWCGRGRASPVCPSRLQHPVSWLEDLTFACYFGASEMLSYRLVHVILTMTLRLAYSYPLWYPQGTWGLESFSNAPGLLLPWPAPFLSLHLLFHAVVTDSQMGRYFIAHTHTHTQRNVIYYTCKQSFGETSL